MKYYLLIFFIAIFISCDKEVIDLPQSKQYPKGKAVISTEIYFKDGGSYKYMSANKYVEGDSVTPQTLIMITDTLIADDFLYLRATANEDGKVTYKVVCENKRVRLHQEEYTDGSNLYLFINESLIQ